LNVAQQGVCVTALSIIIALLSNVKQLPVAFSRVAKRGLDHTFSNVDAAFGSGG